MSRLSVYPTASARGPLIGTIARCLGAVLSLPENKRDTASTQSYLATYAKHTAFETLQNLIWPTSDEPNRDKRLIRKRSLLLACSSSQLSDLPVLLDLAVIYARTNPSQIQSLFAAETKYVPIVADELVPGFTRLLTQGTPSSQGLYAQRKLAECILTFLIAAKPTSALLRPFAQTKSFILALASFYDTGLSSIATSYGGTQALMRAISSERQADDWERIWLEAKVCLLDAFHILFQQILEDLASSSPGAPLAAAAEKIFDIMFSLLDLPSSTSSDSAPPTPFLNRSIIADYQSSYSLSRTLATALKNAQGKDVRLDLLESTLASFEEESSTPQAESKKKNPGALKILLRSSGIQPGIDNLGIRHSAYTSTPAPPSVSSLSKGKTKAPAPTPPVNDPDLDLKTTQVLDIFPSTDPSYIRSLLLHDRFERNSERVIEALLEGTAPSIEEVESAHANQFSDESATVENSKPSYTIEDRKNVFDNDLMDINQLRYGKKSTNEEELLRDRAFVEQMKADILRRAAAISDSDSESEPTLKAKGKSKVTSFFAPDDEGSQFDEDEEVPCAANLRVLGDGEESAESDSEDEDADDGDEEEQGPESLIEQAYISNPSVFERDAQTRRSKARSDLKTQTGKFHSSSQSVFQLTLFAGWSDEQIEGWKIMLDRDPKSKSKLAEKYEFRGNEKGAVVNQPNSSQNRGRGRGRGGGRGRGRGGAPGGGGRGGSQTGGTGEDARERAWKDKHKSSQANHNRKRGHDKKMARAGAGPST